MPTNHSVLHRMRISRPPHTACSPRHVVPMIDATNSVSMAVMAGQKNLACTPADENDRTASGGCHCCSAGWSHTPNFNRACVHSMSIHIVSGTRRLGIGSRLHNSLTSSLPCAVRGLQFTPPTACVRGSLCQCPHARGLHLLGSGCAYK